MVMNSPPWQFLTHLFCLWPTEGRGGREGGRESEGAAHFSWQDPATIQSDPESTRNGKSDSLHAYTVERGAERGRIKEGMAMWEHFP